MSFLASLFSGPQDGDEEEGYAGGSADNFPELSNGMTVTVLLKDGRELFSGKVTAFTKSTMTLERLPGRLSFPLVNMGTSVFVRGLNKDMSPFSIRAVVQSSSRICYKLKDLKAEPFEEQRFNFRLRLNTPASLFYEMDEHCENPESCTVVDISTGGACIESEFMHAEEEVLRLKVKIEEYKPMLFIGEVIRVVEYEPGKYRYGFLFAQLQETEQTELTRTLYNVQLGNRRERIRSTDGHW